MKCSNIPAARQIIVSCKKKGIKHIVISPGSRNAPLIIGFTENPFFECYSIVDERVASFFALGMAVQQDAPVVLVCTSGSALLNYYPAIAEAFYSNIPLVVISADRPPYRIDIGDGQTIRQKNVYQNHIGYSSNLKLDVSHSTHKIKKYDPKLLSESQSQVEAYNAIQIEKALDLALENTIPTHINVPFEEPLYEKQSLENPKTFDFTKKGLKNQTDFNIDKLKSAWKESKRKMVLIGVNKPNEFEVEALNFLAQDSSVVVFTETTSNVHHKNFFPSIDSIVFPIEKSSARKEHSYALKPDLLLTFGGMIVSKKIKAFLREYKPKMHWHIGKHRFNDTYFSLTDHIQMDSNTFLKSLYNNYKSISSDYFSIWNAVKNSYLKKRDTYLRQIPFSDFWVFGTAIPKIPKNYQVHMSNSSTIRYSQLFDMDPTLQVFCNRGTSGIDGSTSTAIGAAFHNSRPTLLITGDLSFFYDSNALWNNYIRKDLRILLVNNSGGGIFRILPGKEQSKNFETFFETRHNLKAQKLCELYSFDYLKASSKETFLKQIDIFFNKSEKPMLLEIFTPPEINDKILLDYFDFISLEAK